MTAVFDASALIALLRNEPGAREVQSVLESDRSSNYVHALNLCEIYYDFWRAAGKQAAESAIGDLRSIGIKERNDLDTEFWREVGRVKAVHRRVWLADCCALIWPGDYRATLSQPLDTSFSP